MFVFLEWWMSGPVTNNVTCGPQLTIWHIAHSILPLYRVLVFFRGYTLYHLYGDKSEKIWNILSSTQVLLLSPYFHVYYCEWLSLFFMLDIKICFMLITLFNLFSHQTKTNIWTKIFDHMNFRLLYWY